MNQTLSVIRADRARAVQVEECLHTRKLNKNQACLDELVP